MPHRVAFLLLLSACKPSTSDSGDTDRSDTDDVTGTERTLDNCGGTIESDVPAFFSIFFACIDAEVDGDEVVVHTIDLPPHPSPYYAVGHPNNEPWDDRGGDYHQNPNTIGEQDITLRIPLDPVPNGAVADETTVDQQMGTNDAEYDGGPVGVNLDGSALFSGLAAQGDDIADEQYTFDTWEAHPAGSTYHHHGANPAATAVITDRGLDVGELFGILCDGTVVLGCTELDGSAISDSLDAQGGHVGDISDSTGTYFADRYHTHVCASTYIFTPEIQTRDGCARN